MVCGGRDGVWRKGWCVEEVMVCGGRDGVWRKLWCVEEVMVCGGRDGVWRKGWCVEEVMVCGGSDGVWRKGWCVEEVMVCGGSDGVWRKGWCVEEVMVCGGSDGVWRKDSVVGGEFRYFAHYSITPSHVHHPMFRSSPLLVLGWEASMCTSFPGWGSTVGWIACPLWCYWSTRRPCTTRESSLQAS